jgi:hypothetical protein
LAAQSDEYVGGGGNEDNFLNIAILLEVFVTFEEIFG